MNLKRLVTLCLIGALLMVSATASAQTIAQITVKGNDRVEDSTVLNYVPLKTGDNYDAAQISEIIRSLYATDLFEQVEVQWETGDNLVIVVKENPLVNKVVFEGNDLFNEEKLAKIISLKSRNIYTTSKVRRDVDDILAAYRQLGRFLTKVEPQIIRREQNRVDVVYNIAEGPKTSISKIDIVGNNRFSDGDLKEIIATRESRWWRFLSGSDNFNPDRIEVDKELLRRYYISKGHAEFRVVSAVSELSRDRQEFYITYTIFEGPTYDFNSATVELATEAEGLNLAELQDIITIKQGERFDGERVDSLMDNLVDTLGVKGFAFLDVAPQIRRNEAERTVDVSYNVVPGPRVYINRIDIRGNTTTEDHVIRREMRLAEGDAFSSNKIRRSKDRVTYTGYFAKVDVKQEEGDEPDRLNMVVDVEEQSTGEFNIGAGFSTYEGALATTDLKERNFLGKGQEVSLAFSMSSKKQDFNLGFTEPWFMGEEISAGVDAYNQKWDFQSESSYDMALTGAGLRFGFPLDEYSRNSLKLAYKETKIEGVSADTSKFVKRNVGKKSSLLLSNTYSIDTRDSRLDPTKGYNLAVTGEYSGFGSDLNFLRGTVNASWNKEIWDNYIFTVGGRIGAITNLEDNDLPLYEYFGGSGIDIRGFESGGVGPRDSSTDDALGGKYMVGNTVELTFPLPVLTDMGVKGVIFSDGGIITGFDNDPLVQDAETYRVSAGVGVKWRSPLGPLRFEFGFPVSKAGEDHTRTFNFSFGTRF